MNKKEILKYEPERSEVSPEGVPMAKDTKRH